MNRTIVTFDVDHPIKAHCKAHHFAERWDVVITFAEDSLCMALSMRTLAEKFNLAYPTSLIRAFWPTLTIDDAVVSTDVKEEISTIISSIAYTLPTLRTLCQMTLRAKRIYQHEMFLLLLTREYEIPVEELQAIDTHAKNLLKMSQRIPMTFGFPDVLQ